MNDAVINVVQIDRFQVLDSAGSPVTGLIDGNFTRELFRPDGTEVSGSVTVTISELSNGWYEASWTMAILEYWSLVIYHATYFPEGKVNDYWVKAVEYFDSSSDVVANVTLVATTTTNTDMANPVVDMEIIVPPLVTISDAGTGNEYYTFTIVLTTSRGSIVTAAEITDVGSMTTYRKPKGISTSWVSKGSVAMVGTRDGSIHASLTFTTAGGYAPGDDLRFLFEGQQVTIGGVLYELINTGLGFFHFSHIQEYDLTLEANATTNTNSIIAEVDANEAKIDLLQVDVTILKKIATGRWKIDSTANTMIFYDSDETTPLYTFDLKDASGVAASENVYERDPQ